MATLSSASVASKGAVGGRPPPGTYRFAVDLNQLPAISDSCARRMYAALSYLERHVYGSFDNVNDDEGVVQLDVILCELEEGFRSTKAGRSSSPCGADDGYEGIAHIVESNGTLTVLVQCRDGFLREQETQIALPAAAASVLRSTSSDVNSPSCKRLHPATTRKLSNEFFAQLNDDVDAYFWGIINSAVHPWSERDSDTSTRLTIKLERDRCDKKKYSDVNATSTTMTKRRSRDSPRLLRVLGHCSPKDYITHDTSPVIICFETDRGIGLVSAEPPLAGFKGYKCSASPLPVKVGPSPYASTPKETSGANKTTSPETNAFTHEADVETAKKALARSRIDNIVLLLSRMQQDDAFVDECCRLMGFVDKCALVAMSLNRLRSELENYS